MKPRYRVSINLTLETNEPIKEVMQELCDMIKIARVDDIVQSASPGKVQLVRGQKRARVES